MLNDIHRNANIFQLLACWLALLWLWETLVGLWLSAGGLPSGLAGCRVAGLQLAMLLLLLSGRIRLITFGSSSKSKIMKKSND